MPGLVEIRIANSASNLMMAQPIIRGMLLRDITARTVEGANVQVSDFRGRRNIVLIFPGQQEPTDLIRNLTSRPDLAGEEAVVLTACDDNARTLYDAPNSAMFITDRYGEIFFSARHPDPLPDAAEVLKWLEFINSQCPE